MADWQGTSYSERRWKYDPRSHAKLPDILNTAMWSLLLTTSIVDLSIGDHSNLRNLDGFAYKIPAKS